MCSQLMPAEPGQSARYEAMTPEGTGTIEFAIVRRFGVEPSSTNPSDLVMQTRVENQEGIRMVMQVEMAGSPDYDPTWMVIQAADQPPMLMPPFAMAMARGQMDVPPVEDYLADCLGATFRQMVEATVPAGTFESFEITPLGADPETLVRVVPEVPFGIVSVVSGDTSMVLAEYGYTAVSLINQEPQAVPGL